jgi:CRP-like cAMP-binding protein
MNRSLHPTKRQTLRQLIFNLKESLSMNLPAFSKRESEVDGSRLPLLRHETKKASAQTSEDFVAAWNLLQMYGTHPLEAEETLGGIPFKTLPERLAELLLDLSDDGSGVIRGLSYQTLADYLGTYRETVGAILRAFSRQKLVELSHGEMHVVDREALQEIGMLA